MMGSKVYQIAGCDVAFPRQPYGVQLAFMAKLIKSVDSGQNALLEAPTGCGAGLQCESKLLERYRSLMIPPIPGSIPEFAWRNFQSGEPSLI